MACADAALEPLVRRAAVSRSLDGEIDGASDPATVRLLAAHGLPQVARGTLARPEAAAWPQPGKTGLTVGAVRLSDIRLVDDVVYFEVGPAGR